MRALSLGLLLSGSLVLPAHAVEAKDWLLRLVEAEQQQSFHGTFVYERNGSFSTHSVWHRIESDGEVRERLLQLDGPELEVLRVNDRVECASADLAAQFVDGSLWSARALEPAKLEQWYDLRTVGESRVAGRSAVVLAVIPRDQHRYGFELHLDRETGLPLKSLLLNEKGQQLERFQFTAFEVDNSLTKDRLRPAATCLPIPSANESTPSVEAWHPEWLPPGFKLDKTVERPSAVSGEPVVSMMYGDGLARFSVFIEPLRGATVDDARTQLGPTVAISKRMSTDNGDVMVTVVGEIPPGTAERVALSMRALESATTP